LLLARQGWSTGTGILALVHDSDSVESLVETARRLAARSGSRLHLRVAASQDEAGEAALQRLRALQQSLTATRPALSVTIDRCRFDAVASAARQARARLIIMPWLEEADTAESLKSIVRATRSAVLLVK
jgi:phage terminase large subunit-like protein